VSPVFTLAAEIQHKSGDTANDTELKGWDWLVFGNYVLNEKWNIIARVSGENPSAATKHETGIPSYTQYTIGPSYTVTPNLTVRAEYSYYKYNSHLYDTGDGDESVPSWNKNFFGIQVLSKF
jgi:opacity protein-like surface antigen